jgi:acyl-CoA thioester hydrolase
VTLLTRYRIDVRFSDCDPFGHVNNARYLTYIEQARIDLWRRQLGWLAGERRPDGSRGQAFILARAEVDFRAQARYGDTLEVRIRLGQFGRTSLGYEYDVVRVGDEALVAAAKTVQVWFDYDANRPAPFTGDVKAKLSAPATSP